MKRVRKPRNISGWLEISFIDGIPHVYLRLGEVWHGMSTDYIESLVNWLNQYIAWARQKVKP